jgi:UDP-glucose 4-epimerase
LATHTLITGGAGFIGSHLAELLHQQGRSLVIVDNLSTGRRSNVEHLLGPRCRLIEARLADAVRSPRELLDGVDEVYHLAAAVGVKLVVDEPADMIRNNVEETAALLQAIAGRAPGSNGTTRVLVASSSEVYGKGVRMPLAEDDDLLIGPTTSARWSYALSKALDEHLLLAHHRRGTLRGVVVRLFNTIGPRQVGRYGMVVPRFVQRAVQGRELEIYGDGRQTRAFCDVRDVVRAMAALMADEACHGQVFNLGSEREITVEQLADRVIALAGVAAGPGKRFIPYDRAYDVGFEDPQRRVPDLRRIRAAIGFEPRYDLDRTLTELIALARQAPVSPPESSDSSDTK